MKYIAKPSSWFEAGTEAIPISLNSEFPVGVFEGWRICKDPISELHAFGFRYLDQENCNIDEFEIVDDEESQ